jgi:S-formylglutathione hydrolase FrmB
LFAVGVLSFDPSASGATQGPFTAGGTSHGLTLVAVRNVRARVVDLTFTTKALDAETHVRVLLPAAFDPSGRTRYPVMYLLHGANTNYTVWTDRGETEKATQHSRLIVVMPDTGTDGWWSNWWNYGRPGAPQNETYSVAQLVPWIDDHMPTIASRAGRAIAGVSMGGFGAMHLAARHPDLFSAVASFSGAVDSNAPFVVALTSSVGPDRGYAPAAIFGPRPTDEVRSRGHNPWDLAANLRGLRLFIATGDGMSGGPDGCSGDVYESQVHEESVALHQQLVADRIAHTWLDYGPGCHNFYYWNRDLRQWLSILTAWFAHPAPPPVSFAFNDIDPGYSVYGWSVALRRPALEWSELSVRAGGFTLRGSGSATVTTPAEFRPGRHVRITVVRENGTRHADVTAGPDGRLRIDVTLGTSNPFQAYTAQARAWRAAQSGGGDAVLSSGSLVWTTTVRIGS